MLGKFIAFMLCVIAVVFAMFTIFNPDSYFYIEPKDWGNFFRLITGQ